MTETFLNGFTYTGSFTKSEKLPNLINFDWFCDKKTQKDIRGRVYLFVEEDKFGVKKILKIVFLFST